MINVIRIGISAICGMAVVLGEIDDSPGLGGLGLIGIGIVAYWNWKGNKK